MAESKAAASGFGEVVVRLSKAERLKDRTTDQNDGLGLWIWSIPGPETACGSHRHRPQPVVVFPTPSRSVSLERSDLLGLSRTQHDSPGPEATRWYRLPACPPTLHLQYSLPVPSKGRIGLDSVGFARTTPPLGRCCCAAPISRPGHRPASPGFQPGLTRTQKLHVSAATATSASARAVLPRPKPKAQLVRQSFSDGGNLPPFSSYVKEPGWHESIHRRPCRSTLRI